MERNIAIKIIDKVAYASKDAKIVCNNSDYKVIFEFDDEWVGIDTKTARFTMNGNYIDVVFTGNEVNVPPICNATFLYIGVFAGDMTTTPAYIRCVKSALCGTGIIEAPPGDVYSQILDMLNNNGTGGGSGLTEIPIASDKKLGGIKVGANLLIDDEGVLSVDTADIAEQDNTRPITSAAVHAELGNIEALLANI